MKKLDNDFYLDFGCGSNWLHGVDTQGANTASGQLQTVLDKGYAEGGAGGVVAKSQELPSVDLDKITVRFNRSAPTGLRLGTDIAALGADIGGTLTGNSGFSALAMSLNVHSTALFGGSIGSLILKTGGIIATAAGALTGNLFLTAFGISASLHAFAFDYLPNPFSGSGYISEAAYP